MHKDPFAEKFGEMTPEIVASQLDTAIKDMKQYLEILMTQHRESTIETNTFVQAFMTAMLKISSLSIIRRSLYLGSKGETGYDLIRSVMAETSIELVMKAMMDGLELENCPPDITEKIAQLRKRMEQRNDN